MIKPIKQHIMFKKNIYNWANLILILCLALVASSCNVDEPEKPIDETKNKLHEDPFKAVFTLQAGSFQGDKSLSDNPSIKDFVPSKTINTQKLCYALTKKDGWHISDEGVKSFKVASSLKEPKLVYLLRVDYFDAKGKLMNGQFIENGQEQIHQHFFAFYKKKAKDKTAKLVRKRKDVPYDYSYTDTKPWNDDNGAMTGKLNPLGFKGFIRFTEANIKFNLAVELVHAKTSKFEADGSVNPFFFPSVRLRGAGGSWDIRVPLPIEVDKASKTTEQKDETNDKPNDEGKPLNNDFLAQNLSAVNKTDIKKVVIKMYEGHLHGLKGFHYVSGPDGITNPFLRLEQELSFEYIQGKWCFKKGATNKFVFFKSKMFHNIPTDKTSPLTPAPVYGCWIEYYNANGQLINGDFARANEYQMFFIPRKVEALNGTSLSNQDKTLPNLMNYVYRDTTPWDRSSKEGARFNSDEEAIGLKGFFDFPTLNRNFLMSIQLWKTKGAKLSNGKVSPFYAPNPSLIQKGEKVLELNIPTYVILFEEDKNLDKDSSLDALDQETQKRLNHLLNLSHQSWGDFLTDMDNRVWGDYGSENKGRWF